MHQFIVKEHDGLFQNLYQILWSKESKSEGEEPQEEVTGLGKNFAVNIPETIVFKEGIPVGWYYSTRNGKLMRRRRESLAPKYIESILKEKAQSDIVCYILEENAVPNSAEHRLTIRYFGSKQLQRFLTYERSHTNGIMQLFIPPCERDSVVQTIWSKSYQVSSQVRARGLLSRTEFGMQYRAVTFDPLEQYEERIPVYEDRLTSAISEKVNEIVEKIRDNSFGNINVSRMVVYWKQIKPKPKKYRTVPALPKLYLLCATGVKVGLSKACAFPGPFTLHPTVKLSRVPTFVNNITNVFKQDKLIKQVGKGSSRKNLQSAKSFDAKQDESRDCSMCGKRTKAEELIDCQYRLIVKKHKQQRVSAKSRAYQERMQGKLVSAVEDKLKSEIPMLLRKMHPKMNEQTFRQKIKSPDYLRKKVPICDLCYFQLAKEEPVRIEQQPTEWNSRRGFKELDEKTKRRMLDENVQFFSSIQQSKKQRIVRGLHAEQLNQVQRRKEVKSIGASTKASELMHLLRVPSAKQRAQLERIMLKYKRLQLRSADALSHGL